MAPINKINELYISDEGNKFVVEELLPVVEKYLKKKSPKILEIGCGYGRNLSVLAGIKGSTITGCDIEPKDLKLAEKKKKSLKLKNVNLVLQKDPNKLPFEDNSFDFIILWQVFEHIFTKKSQENVMKEATRVVKNNGHILIETPNLLFPFDYHDNGLPFVHWIFPNSWRRKITKLVRKYDFPPSKYVTIFQLKSFIKKSSFVKSFEQKTKIYFEEKYFDVFRNLGGTRIKFKIIFFVLYAPIYLLLRILHLPGDLFSPSLRVVFKINK